MSTQTTSTIVSWGSVRHFLEVLFFPNVYRYLFPGEHQIYSERRHVIVVVPWLLAATSTVLAAVVAGLVDVQAFQVAALGAMVIAVPLAGYHFFEWFAYRVFISDRRLVELKGLAGIQVNMMPLNKITDMAFDHSIPGIALGYGKFRVETAGQDQALGTLRFMVNEDQFYAVSTALAIDRVPGLNNLAMEGYLTQGTIAELIADGILNEETTKFVLETGMLDSTDIARLIVDGELSADNAKFARDSGLLDDANIGSLLEGRSMGPDAIRFVVENWVLSEDDVVRLVRDNHEVDVEFFEVVLAGGLLSQAGLGQLIEERLIAPEVIDDLLDRGLLDPAVFNQLVADGVLVV